MFYAGLLQYHGDNPDADGSVPTLATAKKLAAQFIQEHKDDEQGNFYGIFTMCLDQMEEDGFFKLTGLETFMGDLNVAAKPKKTPKKPTIIWTELYPAAVRIGMSRKEFLRSTIRDLQVRIREYEKGKRDEIETQVKLIEYQSWLSGLYVKSAVSSALSGKAKYPDKPITEKTKKPQLEEKTDVPKRSEAELKQEERYYELLIKKANANIAEIGSEEGRQDE